jgi:hypothetical protein
MTARRKWRYAASAMTALTALFFCPQGPTTSQAGLLIDAHALPTHSQLLRVQAQNRDLNGVWVSAKGERFEVKQNGNSVRIEYRGSASNPGMKGVIAGQYDGKVSLGGAYEVTDGAKEERGVVRFVLTPDGKLDGTRQSLTSGGQPERWVLTRESR